MIALLILSVLSFFISVVTVGLIRQRFSQQLLDIPNERSSHTQPTPRGGGVGFIIAFAITSAVAVILKIPVNTHLSWWLIIIPLAIIGILDDRFGVSALIRYLLQLSVAIIAVVNFGAFSFPWLANLGIPFEYLAIAITVIGITAMINFYNFIDGLDGLAAGCTIVQLGFLAVYLNLPILFLLVAAIFGFLYWNWSPAKIFMGDVGSTVLGAIVAIALLDNHHSYAIAITLPVVADTSYTMIRRALAGENIFQAHRQHLYQRLQKSGLSHGVVASIYIGINCLVAVSISFFAGMGAALSLIFVISGIIAGEIYLPPQQKYA